MVVRRPPSKPHHPPTYPPILPQLFFIEYDLERVSGPLRLVTDLDRVEYVVIHLVGFLDRVDCAQEEESG
jgi:hypothetical protein